MSLEGDSPESECLERLQEHEVRASAYYYEYEVIPESECLERLQEHEVQASAYYYEV